MADFVSIRTLALGVGRRKRPTSYRSASDSERGDFGDMEGILDCDDAG